MDHYSFAIPRNINLAAAGKKEDISITQKHRTYTKSYRYASYLAELIQRSFRSLLSSWFVFSKSNNACTNYHQHSFHSYLHKTVTIHTLVTQGDIYHITWKILNINIPVRHPLQTQRAQHFCPCESLTLRYTFRTTLKYINISSIRPLKHIHIIYIYS